MMKTIDKNIVIYDEEFQMRDSFEKWFVIKNVKINSGLVSYVRPFRVQKVLNHNIHLN